MPFSLSVAKVPRSESSTYISFTLWSESTWERKFQLSHFGHKKQQNSIIYKKIQTEGHKRSLIRGRDELTE